MLSRSPPHAKRRKGTISDTAIRGALTLLQRWRRMACGGLEREALLQGSPAVKRQSLRIAVAVADADADDAEECDDLQLATENNAHRIAQSERRAAMPIRCAGANY